jgi:putative transcriptional regulator
MAVFVETSIFTRPVTDAEASGGGDMAMNDDLFAELIASLDEAGRIARGEAAPSRTFEVAAPSLDVAAIRKRYNLSQTRFAALLGISVKTLRNWEQGRREPVGAARVLLMVAARHPDAVWDVVREQAG